MQERTALEEAMTHRAHEAPPSVLLSGEPGIGKARLSS
jgi:hypothetical protein